MLSSRLKFSIRCAGWHLLLSLLVASLSSLMVFWGWYPFPYSRMLGVFHVFLLAVVADVICGPLLTLVLSNPKKTRRERVIDFSLVGLIQIIALGYALHSIYIVRPVVLAYEKDRYVVVSANEIQTQDLGKASENIKNIPMMGIIEVGTRSPRNGDEFMKSAELSLAGISPAMRPGWWVPLAENQMEMESRAKSLSNLIEEKPDFQMIVTKAVDQIGVPIENLRYLPITTSSEKDWIAVFETTGVIITYIPVDGF